MSELNVVDKAAEAVKNNPIELTEKAAHAVLRIMQETLQAEAARASSAPEGSDSAPKKLYLRIRVVGAGCSGMSHKLDLDPDINEKLDEVFEAHGVSVVVDKRSLLYAEGAKVDYHDELNRTGFSFTNPKIKSTCGCGSSWSM